MNKLKKFYKKFFVLTKVEKERIHAKGFIHYILTTGVLKMGLFGGLLIGTFHFFFQYFRGVDGLYFISLFSSYSFWIKRTMVIGVVSAILTWDISIKKRI